MPFGCLWRKKAPAAAAAAGQQQRPSNLPMLPAASPPESYEPSERPQGPGGTTAPAAEPPSSPSSAALPGAEDGPKVNQLLALSLELSPASGLHKMQTQGRQELHYDVLPDRQPPKPYRNANGGLRAAQRMEPQAAAMDAGGVEEPGQRVQRRSLRGDGVVQVGRLEVMVGNVLGYGSSGTVVCEGRLDGARPVAIKRMLRHMHEFAQQEIDSLILSDSHPNVVRYFAMEEDEEFLYLALERCRSTLAGLAEPAEGLGMEPNGVLGHRRRFRSSTALNLEGLLDEAGQPSELCWRVSRDIAKGLAALHDRGIVHRDLKPANVLLTDGLRAKLSDMGLSRQLVAEQSSFSTQGSGSSGWQAPEILKHREGEVGRQTKAVDVFSMGCVLYYCWTGGRHPFGDISYERDAKILNEAPNLEPLQHLPEAADLVKMMLAKDPAQRPCMEAALAHPVWWPKPTKLDFLIRMSDRMKSKDSASDKAKRILWSSTGIYPGVTNWSWKLDNLLVDHLVIERYKEYNFHSMRDLLRLIRNYKNHFTELPQDLQDLMGPVPLGYYTYYSQRFPRLLLTMFSLAHHLFRYEAQFQDFLPPAVDGLALAPLPRMAAPSPPSSWQLPSGTTGTDSPAVDAPAASESAPVAEEPASSPEPAVELEVEVGEVDESVPREAGQPQGSCSSASGCSQQDDKAAAGKKKHWKRAGKASGAAAAASPDTAGVSGDTCDGGAAASAQLQPDSIEVGVGNAVVGAMPRLEGGGTAGSIDVAESNSPGGSKAAVPQPPPPPLPPPAAVAAAAAAAAQVGRLVGYKEVEGPDAANGYYRNYPQNPGGVLCDYYVRTGFCKYGSSCFKDHPLQYRVKLNQQGYPLRSGQPRCSRYMRTATCDYGEPCWYHHPNLRPVFAGEDL